MTDERLGFRPMPELSLAPEAQTELRGGILRADTAWNTGTYASVFLPERSAPLVAESWRAYREKTQQPPVPSFSGVIGRELIAQYCDDFGVEDAGWLGDDGYDDVIEEFRAHMVDYPLARAIRKQLAPHILSLPDDPHILSVDDIHYTGTTELATRTLLELAVREAGKGTAQITAQTFFDRQRWAPALIGRLLHELPAEVQKTPQLEHLLKDLLRGGIEDGSVIRPLQTWEDVEALAERYGTKDYARILAKRYEKNDLLHLRDKVSASMRQLGSQISP